MHKIQSIAQCLMNRILIFAFIILNVQVQYGQRTMTPELLWQLGRVSPVSLSNDQKNIIYRVSYPSLDDNNFESKYFSINLSGSNNAVSENWKSMVSDNNISPDGKYRIFHKKVKLEKILGTDYYPELPQSDVKIYEALHYRHWDTWSSGEYNHVFFKSVSDEGDEETDIMSGEPYHCPQIPFGGAEDYIWSPDSKKIIYVAKKLFGTQYALSTNTDLYEYNLQNGQTTNLTEGMKGYDYQPSFSSRGTLAWISMKRDGYEADKHDIVVKTGETIQNLTAHWNESVREFKWSDDGALLYFTAAVDGTAQLFEVDYPGLSKKMPSVKQLTKGDFDVNKIIAVLNNMIFVGRSDMNTATEIWAYDLKKDRWRQITNVNSKLYSSVDKSKVERRKVKTTDNQEMLVWVIYPPDFDPSKKYPTLLYCQGGPQSALTQFYSFRWNFQLMAANGYIIVAPNRRGMPGHGVEWNEDISKDWGGQAMQDYLSAIDEMAKETYVDENRLGAVGASYGGYSVFQLAGTHQKRFKSFISHCGLFNLHSFYGTTEELFFANWDIGGPYWESGNEAAQKSYLEFNPINFVSEWDTPILVIHGGRDYRVPLGQGLEAFQAAQIKGIKSRLVLFPEENHWVLNPQNGLVWQREFFRWLRETL
jgi:dipeptidyl aminopeptidase/acylaminoacyl peptidase